ncbi:MAG: YozQ family protein [Bacillaceae bacterium]|nr:YozQ family protein [Bacillaceae bacterium]
MENQPNKKQPSSESIAGRTYEVEDYQREDQLSAGLAETHEQVSDSYMAGETFQQQLENNKKK